MKGLNLNKFQKVKTDGETSTFQHQDGHQIIVAHGKLSKKLKSQLAEIPHVKMAQGGAVGGPCKNPNCHSYGKPHPNCQCYGGYAEGGTVSHKPGCPYAGCAQFAEGTPSVPYPDEFTDMVQTLNPFRGGDPAQLQAQHDQAMASLPKTPQDIPGAAAPTPDPVPAPTPQAAPPVPGGTSPQGMPMAPDPMAQMGSAYQGELSGLEQEKRGEQGAMIAGGKMGEAQAKQQAAYQNNLANVIQKSQEIQAHLIDQDTKMQADIAANHINPRQYIDSMSTGGKISTAIGLILGGMGSGLTHGPNLAFQYLQSQIDRDIDSQKAELGKKQNLLSHNIQLMGNARAGAELTRMQLGDLVKSQLQMEAEKAATPIALANAQAIGGKYDVQKAQIQRQISLQQAMLGSGMGSANDESAFQRKTQFLRMMGQTPMAEDMEKKHVSGIPGQASNELTAENRSDLQSKNDFHNKISQYIDFAEKNSGNLDPRIAARGKAMAAELQGLYRQATHGGVYKEGEAHFINQLIDSDPTKFFNVMRGVIPKAKALQDSNMSSLNSLKKSFGFPVQEQPKEAQYKTVNGIKYMRGPNGEAVPVKGN